MALLKPSRLLAVLLILLGGAGFSIIAGVIKILSTELHPFQLVFLRTFLGMVWVSPFLVRKGLQTALVTDHLSLHILRSGAGILAMGCAFYALSLLPMALVTAISFTTPLWMIGLAWLYLQEYPGWLTGLATIAGFAGVLIINPPVFKDLNIGWIAALCSPFFEAVVLVSVKRLTKTESVLNIMTTYGIISTLFWLPVAIWVWQPISIHNLLLMVLVAGIATLGQAATINAYAMAPATLITPFYYVRLIFVSWVGFALLQEVPTWNTWMGALVIVGCNVIIVVNKGENSEQNR
ncbi:MAG: DMT family transporter [Nitrospirae bacterium]|nr:DMT family transporter [Magnetococcales bacterium]HAT49897.1 hypothetical protein [Alphaproteobacteria bacterium]